MTRSRTASSSELAGPPLGGDAGRRLRRCARGQPERRRRHGRIRREQRDALHQVGELAHVARPRIGGERRRRVGVERLGRDAVVGARAAQVVLREHHDVGAALAQRRQRERQHRETVIQVLAEAPSVDRRLQILVGRGEDPDVDRLVACAAQPAHGPLLEHLEQLRLQPFGEEADLVQEDRAAVGGLKQARASTAARR
jgi:hypothetical protein